MIRPATHDDIAAVTALGKKFHTEGGLARLAPYDPESIKGLLAGLIDGPDGILIVAEVDGEVVGMAGGLCFPAYFNGAHRIGQELFWWVAPEHRGGVGKAMLTALEDAARDAGATVWIMIALEAVRPEAVGAVYRRAGYEPVEHLYMRRL